MMLSTAVLECIVDAGRVNHINPDIIFSVILTEGGYSGAESLNKNGTKDLGLMQINDKTWLGLIANKLFDGNSKKAYQTLKNDECFNVYVGSWILSNSILLEHGDLWQGVGRYHSATKKYKLSYQVKVKEKFNYIRKFGISYRD